MLAPTSIGMSPRLARLARPLMVASIVAVIAQLLLVAPIVDAGAVYPNPPNATPVAWPSSFTTYNNSTGNPISDVEGESGIGSVYDISSGGGASTSVFLALSGGAAFFRVRVGSSPVDVSKGGFTNATWLVLIATEDTPGVWTTKAVTGVDGKPVGSVAAPDKVYVGNAPGTGITNVYEFTDSAPAFDPTNAVGTGVRVVSAGGGQYFIDWQVPVSTLVTVSSGAVTASTPVRLFFGSSAAANLATINKDYMSGGAVDFSNLGTVVLSPPTLTLTESKSLVSGPNPPQASVASVYDIPLTAQNTGGSNLFSPSITVTIPAGVSIVSETTGTGTIGHVGQTVTWSPGTMAGGASAISASIRVSITPVIGDVGATKTIANAASGSGTDGTNTITGTGTAQTVGPVADAPHDTTTGVSCTSSSLTYGDSTTCTVTVTDTRVSGATVPTGTVTMSGVLGTVSSCTLATATASTATCSVTFQTTGAGSGSVSASYAGDSTHAASSGTSPTITIGKKSLSVAVDAASKTYGDPNPTFSVTTTGFVLGDDAGDLGGTLSFATSATSASPVGTYAVTASGLTSANYAFSYSPANLTVTKAPLTITADDQSRAYGAANPTLTASYSGFVNGDDAGDLTTLPTIATTATAASPAGTYPITASGAASTNYTISYAAGTLTVGKAALTVAADDDDRVYGDANPTFTATITGFQNGDDAGDLGGTLSCTTTATGASNTGTYPITCSGLTSSDYTFSYVAGDLSVTPATITVTPDPQSRAYGAADPTFTVAYTGFRNGDDAGDLSGAPDCTTTATATSGPGVYAIDCSLGTLSATNYVFDLDATGGLTITTATLTVTADDVSKTYGDPNPTFTATITGFQNGETSADLGGTLSFATGAGAASGVGSYPVTPSGLTSSNYAISFVAGTLSVTKATLTVTPQNAAIAPGDPIPSTFAVDITGFLNGDDSGDISGSASCSTDAVFGDPAGDYTITCTVGTLAAANYAFVIGGTGVLTIGTPTLHITADDQTIAYGDPIPALTVTYSGFVNGDDETSLTTQPTISTSAVSGSPVGTYPLTPSGASSPDYVFDYVAGTLTIEQASQTITFGALSSVTYGDPTFDLTGTSSSGLTVTYTATGDCSVSGITVTITGAGSCTITAHQAGNANYEAAPDVPQTLTITKADPVLTWATPADITYGTALSGTQLNASASVGGSYVYSPVGGTVLSAGTHTLHVTFTPTDGANYNTISTTVDIDVLAASQTIDFPALDNVTSDHDPITLAATASSGLAVTYTVTGPCSVVGNVLTITGVGTCVVTAHQAGNANYAAAPDVAQSFTITPALDSSIDTDKDVTSPGGSVLVTATGFRPGSIVQVRIEPDGDPVEVTADENGTVEVAVTIPTGTKAGPLTIEALGVDPNGAVLDLEKTITVLALPSTSTVDGGRPGAPLGGLQLAILGLFLFAIAAGVNAMAEGDDRRPRPRGRFRGPRLPHAHRMD